MKKLVYLVVLVFLATGFTSCKKIKSWFDVDVEATMSADLEIDIPESAKKAIGKHEFNTWAYIDPMDYGDVAENEARIEEITADGIIATVESVKIGDKDINDLFLYEGTTFSIDDTDISWPLENDWPISVGSTLTLKDVDHMYDKVSKVLTSLDPFTIRLKGEASLEGVSITIRIDFETVVTGNPF